MENITVLIGTRTTGSSGIVNDATREVEFEAEKLAEMHEFGTGRDGAPTDTRGTTETLYRTDDGRLVVHTHHWSKWQGEPTVYGLHEIEEADLQIGGRFEHLGIEAGYGRPLTLDEALTPRDEQD